MGSAIERLCQLGNLYQLCYQCGCKVGQNLSDHTTTNMSDEHFQKMVTTFFIAMDRSGRADEMPTEIMDIEDGKGEK